MSDKSQPILSNVAQYHSELSKIPKLSLPEQRRLEELARGGDEGAKQRLILDCMDYVLRMAYLLIGYLHTQDLLDLIQVGNLALVEHIDLALTREVPTSYLCGIARREMRMWCFYRSGMIQIPEVPQYLDKRPTVVSLEGSDTSSLSLSEQGETTLAGPIMEAIETLPEKQQEALKAFYRLEGYDPEVLETLYRELLSIRTRRAVKRLRKMLDQA